MCDLFWLIEEWETANYADDTTPYTSENTIEDVIKSLEQCSKILFKWFDDNYMKANSDKSHLLLSTEEKLNANINGDLISNSKSEKLLGVTIDSKLNFDEHVSRLCNKASQKLSALARISSYMKLDQKRRIMKAFISSQFGYCPLVWMFCSRRLNNRINFIQKRGLRIVYNDKLSSCQELLEKYSSVSIQCRNLQVLATEIYKSQNKISPPIMEETFETIEPKYNFRRNTAFQKRNVMCVLKGMA